MFTVEADMEKEGKKEKRRAGEDGRVWAKAGAKSCQRSKYSFKGQQVNGGKANK